MIREVFSASEAPSNWSTNIATGVLQIDTENETEPDLKLSDSEPVIEPETPGARRNSFDLTVISDSGPSGGANDNFGPAKIEKKVSLRSTTEDLDHLKLELQIKQGFILFQQKMELIERQLKM